MKFHGVLLVAVILGSLHLSAAEPIWKQGPGRMNLGGKAVLPVPRGYSYHEGPLAPVRVYPAKPTSVKEVQLGVVRRGLTSIVFSYTADPNPAATRWLMRAQAFLNLHLGANAALSALTTTVFRQPRRGAMQPWRTRILENDWFDVATPSLHCTVEIAPPMNPAGILSIRERTTIFFGRHGMLSAESRELAGLVGRDYEPVLQNFSFAPGEAPSLWDRVPLMVSSNIRQLPPYAFGGLIAGLALALLRNRHFLWRGENVTTATVSKL